MAKNQDTSKTSTDKRKDEVSEAQDERHVDSVVEQHPDLDPNEPGISPEEQERRREELNRRQG